MTNDNDSSHGRLLLLQTDPRDALHHSATQPCTLGAIIGVATGGHGWARAHPTSARVGREICTNLKSFFGGVGVG